MRRAMVTADEGEIAQTPVEFTGIHWQSWEGVEFSSFFFFLRKSVGGGLRLLRESCSTLRSILDNVNFITKCQ